MYVYLLLKLKANTRIDGKTQNCITIKIDIKIHKTSNMPTFVIIINRSSTTLGGSWHAPRVDSIPPYCCLLYTSYDICAFE